MKYSLKIGLIIVLLLISAILSFALPKPKYEGTNFLTKFVIPNKIPNWNGVDVSDQLDVKNKVGEGIYNFISDISMYQYVNPGGDKLLFIVLDAGNFHNPKVCFTSAGYEIQELQDTEFNFPGNHFLKTHTLFTKKGGENSLSFYWIVIDKKLTHKWIGQKAKQLYFSLFNKKRVGLMVRIDIPTTRENIDQAKSNVKNFIYSLSRSIPETQLHYILGEF